MMRSKGKVYTAVDGELLDLASGNAHIGDAVEEAAALLAALSQAEVGVSGVCSGWQVGFVAALVFSGLLLVALALVGTAVFRQRRKAAGYENIDKLNHY